MLGAEQPLLGGYFGGNQRTQCGCSVRANFEYKRANISNTQFQLFVKHNVMTTAVKSFGHTKTQPKQVLLQKPLAE